MKLAFKVDYLSGVLVSKRQADQRKVLTEVATVTAMNKKWHRLNFEFCCLT